MIYLILIGVIIFFDLYTKKIINKKIVLGESIEVIKNKFYITHIKNSGGILGFLENKKIILHILSIITLFKYCYYFIKNKDNFIFLKKIGLIFVIGGGFGNILERIYKKNVTDFFYIKYKKLPIFNVADIFVFSGIFFLIFFNKNIEKY